MELYVHAIHSMVAGDVVLEVGQDLDEALASYWKEGDWNRAWSVAWL